ncbi:E3 ubiquitin-protein ligase Su(dx)-like [Tropilaelaps mercedesae]|uniref:E3 ubiquitin-protein ligase Su(Dx)-like n=1 Tax=Tropilaelaps mercedesae TaxID=418985 RepID=A0A1V9WZT2_9ACAR|nr:E3 ubiquitin-protein ligase Su(dx)-like [Tropilaelaps mercedesae]
MYSNSAQITRLPSCRSRDCSIRQMPVKKRGQESKGLLWRIFGNSVKSKRNKKGHEDRLAQSHRYDSKERRKATPRGSSSFSSESPRTTAPLNRSNVKLQALIEALSVHVLPLLEIQPNESENALVSKNRVLFALNHAAGKALQRENVFDRLKQLRSEARQADTIVASFLEKEGDTRLAAVAAKCAACGSLCSRCATPRASSSSKHEDRDVRSCSSVVSWGPDQVTDFKVSSNEVNGGGYYPEPDSDLFSLSENSSPSAKS